MYRVYALKEDDELEKFSNLYFWESKACLSLEFLRKSSVYSLLKRDKKTGEEKMVGGLVVRNRSPYRSVESAKFKEKIALPDSVIEIVGMFVIQSERNLRSRLYLAIGSMLTIILSRQKYILAFTTNEKLWNGLYRFLGAKIIYEGPMIKDSNEKNGKVFLIPRKGFWGRVLLYVPYRTLSIFGYRVKHAACPNALVKSNQQ